MRVLIIIFLLYSTFVRSQENTDKSIYAILESHIAIIQKQYEKSKTFTTAFDTYIFKDKQNESFSKYSVYVIYVYTKKAYPNSNSA